MLRSRIQSGLLHKAGVRTFASPVPSPSETGALQALMLDIGDPVWAFGPTAAALNGFDEFIVAAPFHLVTERVRNVHRVGHSIHTVAALPLLDRAVACGIATTSATRTIIDLARHVSPALVTAALDSALRDGLTSEDFLHGRISSLRSKGRYGIPKLLAIIEGSEASRGGHSWLERRFLQLVADAGLPRPVAQVVLSRSGQRLIRVDCFFAEAALVVEVLGYRWHRTELQMSRDAERANRLMLDGQRMLQFTYSTIAEHPVRVMVDLSEALFGPAGLSA